MTRRPAGFKPRIWFDEFTRRWISVTPAVRYRPAAVASWTTHAAALSHVHGFYADATPPTSGGSISVPRDGGGQLYNITVHNAAAAAATTPDEIARQIRDDLVARGFRRIPPR